MIPPPHKIVDLRTPDGAMIRLRRYGNPEGPRLAVSHGNGLAIDGYFPFWDLLRERYDLMLFDFRNHGQNPLTNFTDHNWTQFVRDLEQIFAAIQAHFGAKPMAGAFHSMSALAASRQIQRHGLRWDPLFLFDPPFYPPPDHPLHRDQLGNEDDIAVRAAKRTTAYADPSELAASFARRMTRWRPETYELMARATLRHNAADGQWKLACPREYEAHIYLTNRDPAVWRGVSAMPGAIKLICGDAEIPDAMPPSLLGRALAAETGL